MRLKGTKERVQQFVDRAKVGQRHPRAPTRITAIPTSITVSGTKIRCPVGQHLALVERITNYGRDHHLRHR